MLLECEVSASRSPPPTAVWPMTTHTSLTLRLDLLGELTAAQSVPMAPLHASLKQDHSLSTLAEDTAVASPAHRAALGSGSGVGFGGSGVRVRGFGFGFG